MSRARQSAPSSKKATKKRQRSSGISIPRSMLRVPSVAKAPKRDVETAHKTEEAVVVQQQLPRADYARERKKVAKRLRKTQDSYLSMFGFDHAAIAASGGRNGGDDPVPTTRCWCPRCRYEMTAEQVHEGFEEGILDYRTECPECQFRFETSFAFADTARFVWLCPDQTRDQFALWQEERAFDEIEDDEIADILLRDRPEIFFNAYRYSDKSNVTGVKARVCQFLEIQ